MGNDVFGAFEEFLVEHVMIGLGNIRATVARLETGEAGDPEAQVMALRRIGGQIDHLEARARALHSLFAGDDPVDAAEILAAAVEADSLVFYSRRSLN